MDKDHIKLIASFEQTGAHLAEFAVLLQAYHKSLCNSGFQRDEALSLVKEFQNILFNQSFKLNNNSEENEDE